MPTSNHFQFNLSMSKAEKKEGKFFIQADVSDSRLDYHDQHMTEKALESMCRMLKEGFPEPDGSLQKVYLLPSHSDTFEIGYAVDGQIAKETDGHLKLSATFELLAGSPQAMQLFDEVAANKCKKQLSVGGDAMGHAYFKEDIGKTVGSLDDVVKLEHVACTRPSKAAVQSSGFVASMLKSIEPLTEAATQEKQEIMDQKAFDELKKSQDDFKTATEKTLGELTTLVKSLTPAPAKTAEQIALEKAAAAGPLTAEGLAAALAPILKTNNEELVKSLMAPGNRTNTQVPNGAQTVAKSTADVVAEALKLAETNQQSASASLVKKKEALAALETERNIIITKRQALMPFTPAEQLQAETLEKNYSRLRTEIHLEEATGVAV